MVLGTSSHVGKSLLTAALCRIFAQHGHRVAPFKSQNMSLNSAATIEGLEIGRAQALQAEAAGVAPSVHMNPILIKPSGGNSSQVVVRGKIWGRVTAAEYHQRRVEELLPIVRESYNALAAEYDVVILEGAGSPAEINLKQHDIANIRMAEMADARCLLVGDIDRGGVFASLLGTLELLEPKERELVRGFAINKFRGDASLLEPGVHTIEDRVQKPCLGVIPYVHSLVLEEEDSLGLPVVTQAQWTSGLDRSSHRRLRVAVIALPSFSNFTDFDSLRSEASVSLLFCRTAEAIAQADVVIVPGSKQTVDDLLWMRSQGLDVAIQKHAQTSLVVGICGGMQMLGETITDPLGMEHDGTVAGLCLLPIQTTMQADKVTRNVKGKMAAAALFGQSITDCQLSGYEIHIGQTSYQSETTHFAVLFSERGTADTSKDGCVSIDMHVFGTYLHGIFDEDSFRHQFLRAARSFHGLSAPRDLHLWKQLREDSLNRLARTVEDALDMEMIFDWVGLPYKKTASEIHSHLREGTAG
ncbi:cobyric acid synthase [Tunturiibacter lichenicola]|uniref:cobyric acid synthase n=1 Tax=Tunturiibacter lichenicola TaxID=2051959 RepID=UPI0021B18651|nr:cobyric acid synthase [Edaphobacter lichenicola]